VKDVRYLGHPRGAIPAKEHPFRWYLLGLVESPPHDIPELVCCLLLFPCENHIQQRAFSDIRQTYPILANKVPRVSQNSLVTRFSCLYCFGLQPSSYLKLWIGTLAVNPKLVPNALLQLLQWQNEFRASSGDSRSSEYRSFWHMHLPCRWIPMADWKRVARFR